MQAQKTKKIFQLRKTATSKLSSLPPDQNKPNPTQQSPSILAQQTKPIQQQKHLLNNEIYHSQLSQKNNQIILQGITPNLIIDQQSLQFYSKINNIQIKNINIKNIGNSAIYYQWIFKNVNKINPNSIIDPKPHFYCHYQPNVIKPSQEKVFSFSFYSDIPGIYVQQVSLHCHPQPITIIPPIKLKGQAYIDDLFQSHRTSFTQSLKNRIIQISTRQVVTDLVSQVKTPPPPLPDITNPQIAQRQFELVNINQKLYYIPQVHKWFTQLYTDICNYKLIKQQQRYWNQSIQTLKKLITTIDDKIYQQSFQKRLQNYKLLSLVKPPQKSLLYPKIKQLLLQTTYLLGGTLNDQTKKQLDMWEIPFQQPSQIPQDNKNKKKDQRTKIIAQWAKKMKKKKWNEDQQKLLLANYRQRLQKRVSNDLLSKFDGFDNKAIYQTCRLRIQQPFTPSTYFHFLQRLKTIRQYPTQSKKLFLKYNLKLKPNIQHQLQNLHLYLKQKKQLQLRLEQQKKIQQQNKLKKKLTNKKKNVKEQPPQQIPTFNFFNILDQQSWEGFIQTFKFICQKLPTLLILGISYGEPLGISNQKYSIQFLMELLKAIQPSIQFLPHQKLFQLKQQIQNQTLNQGSIYLTQNLNFLPSQTMQLSTRKLKQTLQNGLPKQIQQISTNKTLISQLHRQLQLYLPTIDLIVRQDRFVNKSSGICSFGKKDCILGLNWWKYIAFALRTRNSTVIIGGKFTPNKLLMITKMSKYCKTLHIFGQLGLKIWMSSQNLTQFGNTKTTQNEQQLIKQGLQHIKSLGLYQKLMLPQDYLTIQQKQQNQIKQTIIIANKNQLSTQINIVDIGNITCQQIQKISNGHLFIIDHPSILPSELSSLQSISRILANKKQAKRIRHIQQQSNPAGINYDTDLISYIIGINEQLFDKIALKQKKPQKSSPQNDQQQIQQQQQQQNENKIIDQVCDFKLNDLDTFQNLLMGDFNYGLKDISKYPKSI